MCHGYETLLHVMVKLQFWSSENVESLFRRYYSPIHSDLE